MADLLRSLLASPFDRAERSALSRIEQSNRHSVDKVKQLRLDIEAHFFKQLTQADGSFKASLITSELHHALCNYRIQLFTVWPYKPGDAAHQAFFFPEVAPLDWLWLVEQFYDFYDLIAGFPPYKAVINIIENIEADFLTRLLCKWFAVACQYIACKNVAQDKDITAGVLEKIESYIINIKGQILRRRWEMWERPPYKVHILQVKKQTSWWRLQKIKIEQLGLPFDLIEIGLDAESYLSIIEGQIKIGEVMESYLSIAIEEERPLLPAPEPKYLTNHIEKQRQTRPSTIAREERLREYVDNYMKIDGHQRPEAMRLAAEKERCEIDTVERAIGLRKR